MRVVKCFLVMLFSFIFDQEIRCAPLNYVGVIIIFIRSVGVSHGKSATPTVHEDRSAVL